MKKWCFLGSVVLIVIVLAAVYYPAAVNADNTTQIFTPARYALSSAEVDVSISVPNGPVQEQKVMFKIDTITGDVWVLQLSIEGQNDPSFAAANWVKVQHSPQNPVPLQQGF